MYPENQTIANCSFIHLNYRVLIPTLFNLKSENLLTLCSALVPIIVVGASPALNGVGFIEATGFEDMGCEGMGGGGGGVLGMGPASGLGAGAAGLGVGGGGGGAAASGLLAGAESVLGLSA